MIRAKRAAAVVLVALLAATGVAYAAFLVMESGKPPYWYEFKGADHDLFYKEMSVHEFAVVLGSPVARHADAAKPDVEYWYYRVRGMGYSMIQMQFQVRGPVARLLYGTNLLTPESERAWLHAQVPEMREHDDR